MSEAQREARAVKATIDRMLLGYADQDSRQILDCFEVHGTYALAPDRHVGGLSLRPLIEQLVQASPDLRITERETVLADDLALHVSAYASNSGGTVHQGISVAVLRRQDDGRWLVAIEHPAGHRLMSAPG